MGQDKALLRLGNSTFIEWLARRLADDWSPTLLVGRPEQRDSLPPQFRFVPDRIAGAGPLAGLLTGLESVRDQAELALVLACDSPLFPLPVAQLLRAAIGDADAAIPHCHGRWYGLTALYRTGVVPQLQAMLAAGHRRLQDLPSWIRVRPVKQQELAAADPELLSLQNVNTPEEYQTMLERLRSGPEIC